MRVLQIPVHRLELIIGPDPKRVFLRPFLPYLMAKPLGNPEPNPRIVSIFSRVTMLDDLEVAEKLDEVLAEFEERHQRTCEFFAERFEQIRPLLPTDRPLDEKRVLLLGSYFTNEYSFESSALFNPSVVPAPNQSGIEEGQLRFILSLRAIGEGHISSITFRSGVLSAEGEVRMDPVSRFVHQPKPEPASHYHLRTFRRKLEELGVEYEAAKAATASLGPEFLMQDLLTAVRRIRSNVEEPAVRRAAERALALAEANYTVRFGDGVNLSEKILFPYAQNESNGIEDARFVRFVEDDGSVNYYATYTAYDGNVVLPQALATRDFQEFFIRTLNGPAVRNKGLALFPRRIGERYAMLGRQDGENIHIMFSENPHFWYESEIILRPSEPWEFVQIGNCGSPIETKEGWLVLTHGVGPMRKYCVGAALLDLEEPRRVIGRLREPLLGPASDEREGYVPNVVYSCGGLIHAGNLLLPYAISDSACRFAVIRLSDVLDAMT